MSVQAPHFLLYSCSKEDRPHARWRFVLQAVDGTTSFEAEDAEPAVHGPRLELLTVIRGLEALDQPSRVTLVTSSNYVRRGIAYGLDEWRRNGWTWESFGQMVPVKNHDLWQRLDRALSIHRLEHGTHRFDSAHPSPARHHLANPLDNDARECCERADSRTRPRRRRGWLRLGHRLRERASSWTHSLAQWGTGLLPLPWLNESH